MVALTVKLVTQLPTCSIVISPARLCVAMAIGKARMPKSKLRKVVFSVKILMFWSFNYLPANVTKFREKGLSGKLQSSNRSLREA